MTTYHIPTLIGKKRDSQSFTKDEINFLISAVANNQIDEAQVGKCNNNFEKDDYVISLLNNNNISIFDG